MRRLPLSAMQLVIILSFPFASYFAFGAAHKAMEIQAMRAQATQLRAEIDALQARNRAIREQIAYLKTDTYLEKAAREQLGLVKPTEIPVLVISKGGPSDRPTSAASTAAESPSPWALWWDHFFKPR